MKYFRFLMASLTLFVAYSSVAFAHPLTGFISIGKGDTLNYKLNIAEAQVPLLKDTTFNREKCLITHCPLTLTNNSNDTLKYIVMSASWWDLYSLDNQNFALAADWWNVFKNGQQIMVLPPHQAATKSIAIITQKSYYRGQKLRIAMSLQRLGFELPNLKMPVLQLMPKTTNLIWSNEVVIN
jgi:hypothetical protein